MVDELRPAINSSSRSGNSANFEVVERIADGLFKEGKVV
jgi:tetratricopeptide (TPR) repeat protein